MSYSPSIAADRSKYGVKITREEYPVGVAGVRLSLSEIARRVREGGRTPSIRAFAEMVIRQHVPPGQHTGSSQAAQILLDYVIENIRYRPDPAMTEWTQSAAVSLCVNGAPMCIPVGDCFPEGTLLLRDDFMLIPIEEIEVRDKIWGRDEWTTVEGKASKGELSVDAITMNNGSTMHLTPDHKVYVGLSQGFDRVRVSDLKPNDVLLQPTSTRSGGYSLGVLAEERGDATLAIESISRSVRKVPCWDIQTADHYVYLPEHDVTVSNCDDLVVALGSLLMSYGIAVRVVKQTFGAADQEHVLIEFQDEGGNWIAADPTPRSPSLSVGQRATASHEDYIDPLDPSAIGMVAGTPHAEFIGVGAVGEVPFGIEYVAPPTVTFPVASPVERTRNVQIVDGAYEEYAHGKLWRRVGESWVEKQPIRIGATTPLTTVVNSSLVPPPSTTFAQAATDLANQVNLPIQAGDNYLNATPPEYAAAISAYQAAGQAGATHVGPEIDLAGASAITQPFTQKAWTLNAALASVATTGTAADAALAQGYAKQMSTLYAQALAAAQGGAKAPPSEWGVAQAAIVVAGAGAIGGVLWALHKKPQSRSPRPQSRRAR